ncbi:hypothetical protein BV25DRAFT_1921712 [Artomyces pyxidatus]|uniref:Uncharacterized protein n=1 Tax=Artomyces pyxidatus TaxID=48021 RepID=A0ACB8SGB0_9AGAM|nr:hypothetical protein BV25DRAFT_1921712 [Artomyces pyxidatus]
MEDGGADGNRLEDVWSRTLRSRLSMHDSVHDTRRERELRDSTRIFMLAERADMVAALHSLDVRINALSPMSRLPPELLVHIFSYCIAESRTWQKKNIGMGWATVTHVCRWWRQVALCNPILWKHVYFPLNKSWAQEVMSRAKSAGVVVSWIQQPETTQPKRPTSDLALDKLDGIEQLRLNTFDGTLNDIEAILQLSAPILEVVDISCSPRALRVPTNLFGGDAPRLRSLSIRGCLEFPWTAPALCNIVNLTVGKGNGFINPTRADLLGALQTMQALEQLALIKCLPSVSHASSSSLIIALPHLQYLELDERLMRCVDFLQHIRMPATGIKLRLHSTHNGPATDYLLLFPLITAAGGRTPSPFTTLSIDAQSRRNLALEGNRSPFVDFEPWRSTGPDGADLQLDVEWRLDMGWNTVDLLHVFCETFSVTDLQKFYLDVVDYEPEPHSPAQKFEYTDWLRVLGSAKDLWHLETWGHPGPALCQALAQTSLDGEHWQRSEPGAPGEAFFLPNLETLKLYTSRLAHVFPEEQLTLRKFLPRLLQMRVGAGLPRMGLELSVYSQRMEEELQGVVESLDSLQDADPEYDHSGSDPE